MMVNRIILFLWLILFGVVHAHAAVFHVSENHIGDFSNAGYDAAGRATIGYDGSGKFSSTYDDAPLHAQTDNERRSASQRASFAPFGRLLAARVTTGAADDAAKWIWGQNKGVAKSIRQMDQRGWVPSQVTEAIKTGQQFPATNLVNKGNPAIRYVHPTTGQSVVQDTVTKEIIHFGGPGFKY